MAPKKAKTRGGKAGWQPMAAPPVPKGPGPVEKTKGPGMATIPVFVAVTLTLYLLASKGFGLLFGSMINIDSQQEEKLSSAEHPSNLVVGRYQGQSPLPGKYQRTRKKAEHRLGILRRAQDNPGG